MKKIAIPMAILFLFTICISPSVTVFAGEDNVPIASATPTGNGVPQDGGLPVGVIFSLAAGVAILAGGILAFVTAKQKKKE